MQSPIGTVYSPVLGEYAVPTGLSCFGSHRKPRVPLRIVGDACSTRGYRYSVPTGLRLSSIQWLKDRKGRTLSYDDIEHYHHIISALSETIRLMGEVDAAIAAAGGFPLK